MLQSMGLQRVGLNSAMEQEQPNSGASLAVQWQRICPPMQKMQVQSLSGEYPLVGENGNPLQHSCLENSTDRGTWGAGYSPWGSQRVGDDLVTKQLQSNSKQTVSLGSVAILANY